MTGRVIDGIEEMKALIGEHLGYSDYIEITQERVNQFAEATGDHQWIHVDPELARKESPFGGPIAHGYMTLALGPALYHQFVTYTGFKMGVNYGLNKVRFISPVLVGSQLRIGVRLLAVKEVCGGAQSTMECTFELKGSSKPACIAEILSRNYI